MGDLYHMPARGIMTEHNLDPGEIVTHITFAPVEHSAFVAIKEKQSFDWPLVSAAVKLEMDGAKIGSARVCAGAVAPIPLQLPHVGARVKGRGCAGRGCGGEGVCEIDAGRPAAVAERVQDEAAAGRYEAGDLQGGGTGGQVMSMHDVPPVDLKPCCVHLRHKLMHVDERQQEPGLVDDSSDTRVFFCVKTLDALGPDDAAVSPTRCAASRGCYCGAAGRLRRPGI